MPPLLFTRYDLCSSRSVSCSRLSKHVRHSADVRLQCRQLVMVSPLSQDATGNAADIAVGWAIGCGAPFAFGEQSLDICDALCNHVSQGMGGKPLNLHRNNAGERVQE